MLHERKFPAMGSQIALWLWSSRADAASALAEAEAWLCVVEATLSRFRVDSELSRLNDATGGPPVQVSPLLHEVVAEALAQARNTDGLFDPTVLAAVRAAGYDRSLEQGPGPRSAGMPGRWSEVRLSEAGIALPAGVGLDLGGIAKGWAADRLVERLASFGPVLVDAGGDVRGSGMDWPVGVVGSTVVIHLRDAAVATSSTASRRWAPDAHHIIDPRSGLPADTDLEAATVWGPTAVACEAAAKTALILGAKAAPPFLRRQGLRGFLRLDEGAWLEAVA